MEEKKDDLSPEKSSESKNKLAIKVSIPTKGKSDSEELYPLKSPSTNTQVDANNEKKLKLDNINTNNSNQTFTFTTKTQTEEKKEEFKIDRKGNMLMFCYDKNGVPLIAIGPNWCLAISMKILIDVVSISFFYFLWNFLIIYIKIPGIIIYCTQSVIYLLSIITNPGIPPKDLWLENYKHLDEIGSYRICNICKVIMRNDDGTDHCDLCNTCIIGADHHCPWTSKCVGKKNLKIFQLFVFMTFTLMIYFLISIFTLPFINEEMLGNKKKK